MNSSYAKVVKNINFTFGDNFVSEKTVNGGFSSENQKQQTMMKI